MDAPPPENAEPFDASSLRAVLAGVVAELGFNDASLEEAMVAVMIVTGDVVDTGGAGSLSRVGLVRQRLIAALQDGDP